jgi:hypothetical protein
LSQKRDASLAKGEPQVTQNSAVLVFVILVLSLAFAIAVRWFR